MNNRRTILDRWGITPAELTELVDQNPSLRGILLGYVAEKKFHDIFLENAAIAGIVKDDNHDRKRKGDRRIIYQNECCIIEVKSLQSNSIKKVNGDQWKGKCQVDASDNRTVTLPDGSQLKTTCLLRNEFDLLAVNCFAFGEQWRFAFALNTDLPKNTYKKYTDYQKQQLLPTLVTVTWPLQPPFTDNFLILLNRLVQQRKSFRAHG